MNTSSPDIRSLSARLLASAEQRRGNRDTKSASDAPAGGGAQTDTVDPADREAFGDFLRQARERRQKTLQQIAQDTKIAPRHLAALEQGNVKSLPGGMYRRAMLRAYADSVGLDKEAALEQFERTFEPPRRTAPDAGQPLADIVSRAVSHQGPRTAGAQLDAAGFTAVAATLTVDPPAPVANRSARSRRGRDMGVLLAVIVASAVGVVGLVTGDRAETPATGVSAPPARSVADETSIPVAPAAARPIAAAPPVTTASAADRGITEPATAPAKAVVPPRADATPADAAPAVAGTSTDTAAAAPPSAPRATTGQLVIATTPPGARVTVNGTGWGVSPVTVRHLPFGSKRIRVTHDGYASQERQITLSAGRPTATVNLTLSVRE